MSRDEIKPVSYKLVVVLSPNWDNILKKLADQNKQKPEEFIEEIFRDEKLDLNNDIDKEASLFGKSFRFVIFYHGISQMYQIWSDHLKTFVDEARIDGRVFGASGLSWIGHEKYSDKLVSKPLILTPEYVAFDTYWVPELRLHELARIPYHHVLRLLLHIGKENSWAPAHAIKKFPKELKKELNENNVKYEPEVPLSPVPVEKGEDFDKSDLELNKSEWFVNKGVELFKQEVEYHKFSTPYYSVLFNLEIFV